MTKSRTDTQYESDLKRGVVSKSYKLPVRTAALIDSLSEESEMPKSTIITKALKHYTARSGGGNATLGYETEDGCYIRADAHIIHTFGIGVWIVITDVYDENADEDAMMDFHDIDFESLFNNALRTYLPGLHINYIKVFYTPKMGSGEFYRPDFSKLKVDMFKEEAGSIIEFFIEREHLYRFINLKMKRMPEDSKEFEELNELF